MSHHYDVLDIIDKFHTLLQSHSFGKRLYESTENICKILVAIVETKGVGWTDHLDNLTDAEKQQYATAFEPFIPRILSFFNAKYEQHAGANEEEQEVQGVDNFYEKIMDFFDEMNKSVSESASIMRMESDFDSQEDIHPIPKKMSDSIKENLPIIKAFSPPASIKVGESLESIVQTSDEINIPFRFIITIIHLFLDILRMSAAATGNDSRRMTLSIAVALLELLRGNWKIALMSMMGYFGSSSLYLGQLGKVIILLFQTLSPTIQTNLLYGGPNMVKSLIIGILLAIFKVTAPHDIRTRIISGFTTISDHITALNEELQNAGLKPLPAYMNITYSDFNSIQALIDDPIFVCSKEHRDLVDALNKCSIVRAVLQMLNIPVTERFRENKCGPGPGKSFIEELVVRQKIPDEVVKKAQTKMDEAAATKKKYEATPGDAAESKEDRKDA